MEKLVCNFNHRFIGKRNNQLVNSLACMQFQSHKKNDATKQVLRTNLKLRKNASHLARTCKGHPRMKWKFHTCRYIKKNEMEIPHVQVYEMEVPHMQREA
uniref:Uncharacterized protein n=1 Tax=Oryza meridionalis TaxID=40149 RepID=A0A0E0F979_9ORYZ